MDIEELFSDDELITLDEILLKEYPNIQMNSRQVLERWAWFVGTKVPNSRLYTLDEYVNDLGYRKIIEILKLEAQVGIQKKLEIWLKNQDEIFMQQTIAVNDLLYSFYVYENLKWLFFRIPKTPGDILRKNLLDRGFID